MHNKMNYFKINSSQINFDLDGIWQNLEQKNKSTFFTLYLIHCHKNAIP